MEKIFNEKDIVDINFFYDKGINMSRRDISQEFDIKTNEYISKINFSGFELDQEGNINYFFPFKYHVQNLKEDSIKLFRTIFKHIQKRPELYFGKNSNNSLVSNYPFASFFKVLEYYLNFGLYSEYNVKTTTRRTGKINWKSTISSSNKYLIEDTLFFDPVQYKNTLRNTNFISDCMAFILEYTIEKFGQFMGLSSLGLKIQPINFLENSEVVVKELNNIKSYTFNTKTNILIAEMINFFNRLNIGGSYYLKHYNFDSIWEDMVNSYINRKFIGFDSNKIVLSGENQNNNFSKSTFYPNSINLGHNIQPDNYMKKDEKIYILDAKYYEPVTIDYKQLCYSMFLSGSIQELGKVYSALLVPHTERKTEAFFAMNTDLNFDLKELKINIEYLDIRDVIDSWISID